MARRTHIPRFHVEADLQAGTRMELPTGLTHHLLKVLRATSGDRLCLFDGDGREYAATLHVSGKQAEAELGEAETPERESALSCSLLQAISRGDRMESTLRQVVELGISDIRPVYTRHSMAPLPEARAKRKWEHWQQVVIGASQQSGRLRVPTLHAPQPLAAALEALESLDATPVGVLRATLTPDADRSLAAALADHERLCLLVGPESGLEDNEVNLAARHGFEPVRLGPRLLRTETAGVAALAVVQALVGDLG